MNERDENAVKTAHAQRPQAGGVDCPVSAADDGQAQSKTFPGDTVPPWRRFLARLADLFISFCLCVLLFLVLYAIPRYMPEGVRWEDLQDVRQLLGLLLFVIMTVQIVLFQPVAAAIATFLLSVPVEVLFLACFGTTPAKWLFGIRVVHPDGTLLSLSEAFRRALRVFAQGLGFGIPFIAPFTFLFAYRRLTKTGTTWWDAATNAVVLHKKRGVFRTLVWVCMVGVFALVLLVCLLWAAVFAPLRAQA